jgi:hypothetical protein
MKIQNGLPFFLLFSIALIISLSHSGCANIIPPTGGPRDTLPPRLISVNPPDLSHHFNTNKILFTFDEYIDPKDIRTELIVSPVPKTDPIASGHLRTLFVKLKDTLQPNTTYTLDFGNAIRDVNEGNILKNFRYVFTTGNYIDSSYFTGHVYIASTGKTDSTMIVMLHKKLDDSAVVKSRPRYIARVDSLGRFHFRHLEPGAYAVYALKDEGGSLRYLSPTQLFAFADSPVTIGDRTQPLTLYAYAEEAETKSGSKSTSGTNKPAATKLTEKEKEKDKRLQFSLSTANGELDVLDTLHLKFVTPLAIFDSTRLQFLDENFVDIPPNQYYFRSDSTRKRFDLMHIGPWPTDTKYYLIAAKDFAQDSAGRQLLKIDTLPFHTKKETDYGEVRIRIANLDLSRNPVLLFVQGEAVKFSYPFARGRVFKVPLFLPGEYELRILYDTNGNGIWDPGQFFNRHIQPEIVQPIPKKFTVKANWDNEKDITL